MKIAVVGSINMDQTVTTQRIPLKGETLLGENLQYIPGGKGANQAVALARLGADVEMFGCVGDDAAGEQLIANLKENGAKTEHIQKVPGVPTGLAIITVGDNDNTIIVVQGANLHVNNQYIDSIREELLQCGMVLLQQEIPAETVEYTVSLCAEAGVKVVLNPAPARTVPPETLEKVSYLTPNEHEAVILFGETPLEDILRVNPEKLIVTQGSHGVITCSKDGEILRVPASEAKVVDTTGAGDTFNAAFTFSVSQGQDLKGALHFANTAAGISTERFGAQGGMPTLSQVQERL